MSKTTFLQNIEEVMLFHLVRRYDHSEFQNASSTKQLNIK